MLVPSRESYLAQTGGTRSMPVYREVLADLETPLSAYWKLAHDEDCSFLLESVTGGEQLARYSLLGVRPKAVLRTKGEKLSWTRTGQKDESRLQPGQDPLSVLQEAMPASPIAVPGLPVFVGGAVGMFAYDLVRFFERLPDSTEDDLQIDDLAMMLTDAVVVFDHAKNLIRVIVLADGSEAGYESASAEVVRILERLSEPAPALPHGEFESHEVTCNQTQEQFQSNVSRIREYIAAGDGIQMVPSLRLSTQVDAHPLTVYRALRSINPSPYMFLLRFGDFDLVGASPELLVSLHGRQARVRPIAGTRRRGATPEQDNELAQDLLQDEKERAEHIMLVDLGRNDLGRVCTYGSITVNELMVIERYSHVMHIVSDVTGELPADKTAFDLLRATFPAGTVSGAPKVRAMQIIDELEPTRRGPYAGSVGFFSATGDMDMCITIRTILMKDGKAYVQAGAGIVYDSDPEKEYEECLNKARASLAAIDAAQRGLV
ncbi:MAG: anthranilate synthase component [Fimbriimonadaceae bacterium]|jgi:anthranilate synthase component 1|nr:anthranilate synthase component [Fimbriimonadaceae bacterium]